MARIKIVPGSEKQKHTRVYINGRIPKKLSFREQKVWAKDKIAAALKVRVKDISFSPYTGCACGCSPGFIIKDNKKRDIFLG